VHVCVCVLFCVYVLVHVSLKHRAELLRFNYPYSDLQQLTIMTGAESNWTASHVQKNEAFIECSQDKPHRHTQTHTQACTQITYLRVSLNKVRVVAVCLGHERHQSL